MHPCLDIIPICSRTRSIKLRSSCLLDEKLHVPSNKSICYHFGGVLGIIILLKQPSTRYLFTSIKQPVSRKKIINILIYSSYKVYLSPRVRPVLCIYRIRNSRQPSDLFSFFPFSFFFLFYLFYPCCISNHVNHPRVCRA